MKLIGKSVSKVRIPPNSQRYVENENRLNAVNALDSNFSTFQINSMQINDIIKLQNQDGFCQQIKEKLRNNWHFSRRSPEFFVKNDLLLCYRNKRNRHDSRAKSVVPKSMGLYLTVKNYIALCHSCIPRRGFSKTVKAPIQKIPIAEYPFQKCAFDAVGPFVTSSCRNKYLIVISDYFTRYAEAYPVENIQSSSVACVLIDFISRHGIMQTLYSDRGSNFLSAAMNEVYEKLGISKQHTLVYNPEGNGLVERLNKTLIDTLSHLVSEKQEDWCQHVPLALMAFRMHITVQSRKRRLFSFMVEICKCLMIVYFVIRLGRTLIRLLSQLNWLIGFSLLSP
ncbi:endonuclease [Caerostris extrusa]|uniref:Endonuclease n=1 Tax=Caerostris extrusa TaxID=172846 RepID=A0AAV4X3W3_CAEEX|nr:endonuclease [Caerostris extrusa]